MSDEIESKTAERPDQDFYGHMAIEPQTLRHLADALEGLLAAREATDHGFVSDYCENAIAEIRKAIAHYGERVSNG